MSRLIVKNLPDKIKESRLRDVFSSQGGEITDVKLCFTKAGVFRKFAFIGFKENDDASDALKFLNKTFIDTSKIQVELCKDLGDQSVPRPWSKYAKGSSAFTRKAKEIEDRKTRIKELQEKSVSKIASIAKQKNSQKVFEQLDEVKDDPEFQEFLTVHSNKLAKQSWTNENVAVDHVNKSKKKQEKVGTEDGKDKEDHSDEEGDSDEEDQIDEVANKEKTTKSSRSKLSDLDWLKSKVIRTEGEATSSLKTVDQSEDARDQDASKSSASDTEDESQLKQKEQPKEKSCSKNNDVVSLTIKMRGIPFKCTDEDIVSFFKPLKIEDIRFPKNKKGKPSGYAFVDFKTMKDAGKALRKDKQKMQGRYVELFEVHNNNDDSGAGDRQWKKKVNNVDEEEDVSDSGRLFIRNLSYNCREEDLEELFSKYGALVEVNLPVDKNSNKSTGFAFVTFMMPEHAVRALNKLDGSIFQGRILHLLPGKVKKTKLESEGGTGYKKKKEAEQKALSASSHNWNALFLGHNAVADVMANRLNIKKHGLLESESSGSVAVRMALGETELVAETRQFLESHGVKLDVFGQANSARSKSVILVKNLPPGTTGIELKEVFKTFGDLGRVLMPPFGITAIVEFIQMRHAKEAFTNLAYSKFKHTPLYLEWAPVDVLTGEVTAIKDEEEENIESDENEEESEAGSVIFVKNLNFDTTEEKLKERFSCCGKLKSVTVAKKKDPKKPSHMLSMGYGFVEYKKLESADKALKLLQHCDLDGHKLELKKSNRETIAPKASRKRTLEKKQTSSKIVVRNIPFEADIKEIRGLFSSFGHIKSLRLPKKMAGTGSHRGFAFIDFTTKQDAKRAFKALCQSTHLYGRRMVLEWADDDDSVELLRQKTAQHYHDGGDPKKRKTDLLSSLDKTNSTNEDEI